MSARVPVEGSLTFIDSVGEPRIKGIDVGQELEIRSFVEGATQAKAVWLFGPRCSTRSTASSRTCPACPAARSIVRPVPVGTCCWSGARSRTVANRSYELAYERAELEAQKQGGRAPATSPGSTAGSPRSTSRDRGARRPSTTELVDRYNELDDPGPRRRRGRATRTRPPGSASEAADPAVARRAGPDDLHRLPDDQGPGRRAGLRRDPGRAPVLAEEPCRRRRRGPPLLADPLARQFAGGPTR